MMSKYTVISLFTGAGGLDLGFKKNGYEIKLCVELDEVTCKTLKRNDTCLNVVQEDIRNIPTSKLLSMADLKKGETTIVIGGPPCQPFSNIGNRKALEDPRGALINEFLRVVNEAQPQLFLFENVPGLKSVKKGRVFKEILEAFGNIGYTCNYAVLNSADFGVPQIRKRLFIIGNRDGYVIRFPKPDHSQDGKRLKKWVTVRNTFNKMIEDEWDVNRSDNKGMNHSERMINKMKLIKPGKNFHSLPMDLRPNCWKNGKHQGRDTFGRIEYDKPSLTIRTSAYNPTKGRYIHPIEHRGLTTMEMVALQTFPKDYYFEGNSIVKIGKQIGDAVPVLLSEKIAKKIKDQLTYLDENVYDDA